MKNNIYFPPCHILWVVLAFVIISCSSLNLERKPDVPSIAQAGFIKLPDQVTDQLGIWAFRLWLKTVEISQNSNDQALVDKVTKKIIGSAKTADQFQWEVVLIEDNRPDAIGFPGGKIGIYTGLLDFTHRSEEWLAVAIGHEIVHVLARHAAERIDEELQGVLITAATGDQLRKEGLSPEATAAVMVAMGVLWQGAVVLPFNRMDEYLADLGGLILMARAGYNPATAITFWEEMTTLSTEDQLPEFLSLHPNHEKRIARLDESLHHVLKYVPRSTWEEQATARH